MVLRQRLAAAALTAGVLAACAYLGWLFFVERRAFLPGPVHAAHASLENDCDACHDSSKASGVSNEKCASCHTDEKGAEPAWRGFAKHHADAKLECTSCHTEHKGRRGDTTTAEARAAYPTQCEVCHADYAKPEKKPFQEIAGWSHADHARAKEVPSHAEQALVAADAHAGIDAPGALGCERCHDPRPSERAHHGEVTIARPDCFNVGCHIAALKKDEGFVLADVHAKHAPWKNDCFACHTWLGKIDSAKCASCHDDGKGGAAPFASGFASHHARRDLDCARCHTEHKGERGSTLRESQADYEASCSACHAGFEPTQHVVRGEVFLHTSHGAKQKLACADCHDVRRDAPAHGKVTLAENACVACHMKRDHPEKRVLAEPWREVSAAHAPWEKDCARCHSAAADVRAGLCADCHKTPEGKAIEWSGFAKHHLDATLACAECHTEHKGREPVKTTMTEAAYRDSCTRCHAQYADFVGLVNGHEFRHKGHTPAQKLECAQCHDVRMDAGAAHGKLTISLDACVTCHLTKKPDTPVGALAKGHADVTDCAACHKDWHAAEGPLCARCHEAEAVKRGLVVAAPATSMAAAPTKLVKEFPTHAADPTLACLTCHTEHKGAAGTERLPGEPRTKTCERCHPAPGGGDYAQPADRSPRRLPAGDPLAPPAREVTFAHAQHDSLACEQCHAPDVKRHARKPGDAPLPLLLKAGDCLACHHGPGGTQRECASCHEAESRFRGGSAPGLDGGAPADAHVGLVKCEECHVYSASAGGFAPTRESCVRCHGEDFGRLYDAERGALATAVHGRSGELAESVRRYGMHNARLAEVLLSPDAQKGGR